MLTAMPLLTCAMRPQTTACSAIMFNLTLQRHCLPACLRTTRLGPQLHRMQRCCAASHHWPQV